MEMRREWGTTSDSWYACFRAMESTTDDLHVAIYILRHTGIDCPSLEPSVRSLRPQTNHSRRTVRFIAVDVFLRSVQDVLGCCNKVCAFIRSDKVEDTDRRMTCSRSLNGALNGNIGVYKSMVAEITDSSNIAYAYAYMPISWSTGQALG